MSRVATTGVSQPVMVAVLAAVRREADLDGLSTPTARRVGEVVGVSPITALTAIHRLADAGELKIVGSVGGGGCLAIQLPDEVTP